MAKAIAERPEVRTAQDPEVRVRMLYHIILAREPQAAELQLAADYLKVPENTPLLAHALLMATEFLFVD
jgi:hypothetical protein